MAQTPLTHTRSRSIRSHDMTHLNSFVSSRGSVLQNIMMHSCMFQPLCQDSPGGSCAALDATFTFVVIPIFDLFYISWMIL